MVLGLEGLKDLNHEGNELVVLYAAVVVLVALNHDLSVVALAEVEVRASQHFLELPPVEVPVSIGVGRHEDLRDEGLLLIGAHVEQARLLLLLLLGLNVEQVLKVCGPELVDVRGLLPEDLASELLQKRRERLWYRVRLLVARRHGCGRDPRVNLVSILCPSSLSLSLFSPSGRLSPFLAFFSDFCVLHQRWKRIGERRARSGQTGSTGQTVGWKFPKKRNVLGCEPEGCIWGKYAESNINWCWK